MNNQPEGTYPPRSEGNFWNLSGWLNPGSYHDWESFSNPEPVKKLVESLVPSAYIYAGGSGFDFTTDELTALCVDLVTHQVFEEVSEGDAIVQGLHRFKREPQFSDFPDYDAATTSTRYLVAREQFRKEHQWWENERDAEADAIARNELYTSTEQIVGMLKMAAFLFGGGTMRYTKSTPLEEGAS